jgi:phospholipid N-methyltransferase
MVEFRPLCFSGHFQWKIKMAVQEFSRFLRESVRQPGRVGAIAPSTQRLALHMVRWIEWDSAKTIVEYGPGMGAFTEPILKSKRPDADFFAVELHSPFAATLATRFPDLTVVEDSVANIEAICQQRGVAEVDAIICGLPWAAFSDHDQTVFLDAMMKVLKPGGQLVTFAYLSGMVLPAAHRFRKKLKGYFGEVQSSRTVWLNFPPAFIYRCRR